MAGFLGADTEQLRQQGTLTAQGAQQLQSSLENLTGRVDSVEWNGPDADAFRGRWRSEAVGRMREACDRLQGLSKDLHRQAEEQDAASDGDGGGLWEAIADIFRGLGDGGGIGPILPGGPLAPGGPFGPGGPAVLDAIRGMGMDGGDRPGQEFYGDEGYGASGQASGQDRPLGPFQGEMGFGDGREVDNERGYVDTYGRFDYSAGGNVTTDQYGNVTGTVGGRAGGELGLNEHLNGPFGTGMDGSAHVGFEAYAEAGGTVGPDGFSAGAKAASGVYGDASVGVDGPFGESGKVTASGFVGGEAHANAYAHTVRNEDGNVNGFTSGFDADAFIGARGGFKFETESPGGWFSSSTSIDGKAGYGVGAGAGQTISTDEVSFSVGGSLAAELGLGGATTMAVHPNAIVNTFTPGDYDIDDAVGDAKGAWDSGKSAVSGAVSSVNPFD